MMMAVAMIIVAVVSLTTLAYAAIWPKKNIQHNIKQVFLYSIACAVLWPAKIVSKYAFALALAPAA